MAGKMDNKPGKAAASPGQKPKGGKKRIVYPGRGRPKVYATAKELAKGVEAYFGSITVTEPVVNIVTGEPELNDLGKPVELVRWLKVPTEGALAGHLGISGRTWTNYRDDPELGPVVEWAKEVIRDYLIEKLVTREKGSANGLIFVLENNYGMKQQVAVEHAGLSLEEFVSGGKAEF